MRKILVVAAREYQAAVRTKTFIVTLLAMPVFMGGSILAQVFLKDKVDTRDKRIAMLDYSGALFDTVIQAASSRNEADIYDGEGPGRRKVKPKFLIEKAGVSSDDPERAAYELSEQVRAGKLFGFFVVGADVIAPNENMNKDVDEDVSVDTALATVDYYSNSPTYEDFRHWVSGVINARLRQLRLDAAGLDAKVVAKATTPVRVTNLGLVELDETGQIKEAEESNEIAMMLVPVAVMMLMFMVIMVGASPLTHSVIEEKMFRIAEVLLGSVTPFRLMMGKLIGTVGVSLTLGLIYLGGGFYAMYRAGYGHFFPGHLVWWFAIYVSLAVLLFGSLFIAVGAAVSDMKEAQNLMMPVMLIVVAPMFVWMNVLKEPTATFSLVLSLIPPLTPLLMILRQSVPPGVPIWQPLLGVVLVLLTTIACVFAAGRVFRIGILMQGKGAKITELTRWILRG